MLKKSLAEFSSPGAEFRGAPFWAWNGKLEEQELRSQIRTMKAMGLGGFFMHARVGLNTKYLSPEWFRLVGACIDEAEKQKMSAWLYDEDRWPSGAAGGLVTKNKKYRLHYAECIRGTEIPEKKDAVILARFAAVMEGNILLSYRRLSGKAAPGPDEVLLTFRLCTAEPSPWFNGQTYLDTLNPEAVTEFIKSTHEAYRKHFGKNFGKSVPGIFSDEPNFMSGTPGDALPWTQGLEKIFRKKYSYDILDTLPELRFLYRDDTFSKYRLDYRNLLTDLFCGAFSRQIGEWCGKNGMGMTGHVLCEDWLDRQVRCVGSAMRFYEYMQVPGIDLLTEHWNIFNTAKQCVSMARQFGRKRRLSETYGCTGWDFPFIGHKALGDWQYALGINVRCQHLAWYTMEAQAKRDYPASISYQSPWFDRYGKVEDYFARLGLMLSEGEEIRDLLVIHPIETSMGEYTPEATLPDNGRIITLTNELLGIHLDFDFGEEDVISRHGSVSGKRFRIGKAFYGTVLLPGMETIRKTTLDLLKKFAENGGKVFYMGTIPERMDGEVSPVPAKVYASFRSIPYSGLDRALSPLVRRVSVQDKDGFEITPVLYHLNGGAGFETLFVCNTSCDFKEEQMNMPLVRDRKLAYPNAVIRWNVPEKYQVYRMDPETGKIFRQPVKREKGAAVFSFPFEILGSGLFLASDKPVKAEAPAAGKVRKSSPVPCPPSRFKVTLEDPNVLVLDTPACTADGKKVTGRNFLHLDILLREMLGKPERSGQMVQPWLQTKTPPEKQLAVTLEYNIRCKDLPQKECLLAVEQPGLYTFTLNGKPLPAEEKGWWCDRSIRCLRIPAERFRTGNNKLILSGLYSEKLPGLESLFLLGDFGVMDDVLVKPVTSLKAGDWTKQGLPYYSGNLIYHLPLPEKAETVSFPKWRGVALETAADRSKDWKTLAWYPFEVPVSGAKILHVRVLGSRRNAFGPFHLKNDWPAWCGPVQFKEWEKDEKGLVPCGLLEKPLIG